MAPLITIRPEPGNAGTVAAARALGLEAFAIRCSRSAHESGRRSAWRTSTSCWREARTCSAWAAPAWMGCAACRSMRWGETTARAAQARGFTVAATGTGGLQPVLAALPPGTRVLRLAGAERVPLELPPGVTMVERVVYASEARPLPDALVALLARPAVIALHSAEAARHFADECSRLGIARGKLGLATIGPRVNKAAGSGWHAIVTADSPAEPPLLAKAADLCQTLGGD